MVFVPRRRRSLSGVGAATPISGADGQARHQGSAEAASTPASRTRWRAPGRGLAARAFVSYGDLQRSTAFFYFFFIFFNSIDILMQMLAVAISFPILSVPF